MHNKKIYGTKNYFKKKELWLIVDILTGGQEQTARWLLTTQLAVGAHTPLVHAEMHLKF